MFFLTYIFSSLFSSECKFNIIWREILYKLTFGFSYFYFSYLSNKGTCLRFSKVLDGFKYLTKLYVAQYSEISIN